MSNYPTRNIAEINHYAYCNKCGRYNIDMSTHTCTAQVVSWQSVGFATHSEYVAACKVATSMTAIKSEQDAECYGQLIGRIHIYETKNNIKL